MSTRNDNGTLHKPGLEAHPQEPRNIADKQCALGPVGVTEDEERMYEVLLDHPGASLTELAAAEEISRGKAKNVLHMLGLKGLVTHTPNRTHRYFPTPPDVALEVLITKQQEALQRVRIAASHLQEKARKAHELRTSGERLIEIVTGREAQAALFHQIQHGAKNEVIGFDRPPYVIAASANNKTEFESMKRGVQYRGIYGGGALELPHAAERIRACMEAGEDARVFQDVPLKLIAADRRIAMVPLDLQQLEDAALLVRSSSLLDALYELFEAIWRRATPISLASTGGLQAEQAATRASAKSEQLVSMLAAGLNDKVIAYQLGVSQRTLDRYIRDFMKNLDARTRFQAGWMAALRFSSAELTTAAND